MGYYMSELYRRYFRAPDFSELKEEIEHTRQEVRDWLDQTPLRLKANLAQASFEAGFRLAMGLFREVEAERIRLELEEEG